MGLHPLDSSWTVYHEMYQEFAKEADARAMEQLHNVKDRLRDMGLTSVEENLLRGHAAEVIVDLAKETTNCLIVMSSHGRSGIGRWVLGSVSDRVARHSGVPVLIIRAAEEELQDGVEEETS
jgi:nucleotide-binding universal stress UspA family protein